MSEERPLNLAEFEQLAQRRLPAMAFDYYASGALDEITLRENRAAFDRLRLRPRMLVGVEHCDSSVELLGRRLEWPLLLAPTAFAALAQPDGEAAIARAAGGAGVTQVLSTLSTVAVEDVAAVAARPLWFQLYVFRDRGLTAELVARAEAAGCEALVLTVDAPLLGRRERDVRNAFALPEGLVAANLPTAESREITSDGSGSGLLAYFEALIDPSLTWDDLDRLVASTSLPVIVKGVLRGDDAALAVEHGAAGVIVSNHGGRQLDSAPASIDVLPEVVAAVDGRVAVLVDGGIRRGTDIVKALALGARAVLIGRPILWGLAADGEAGVREVLALLRAEFDLAMALCGCRTVADIGPDLLWVRSGSGS